jgi:hypothetical protein
MLWGTDHKTEYCPKAKEPGLQSELPFQSSLSGTVISTLKCMAFCLFHADGGEAILANDIV